MTIIEEAKNIINNSGNNFHCNVVSYFKSKGWHTLISPYYTDNATNKPREIDLVVEKEFVYGDGYTETSGTINVKLYIECKYILKINVFWFSDKDLESTKELVINATPNYDNKKYIKDHHYLEYSGPVAKLFAGANNREVENEVIYKALNQSLNAMVYHRATDSIIPEAVSKGHNILETIEYPLIVCNNFDNFLRTDVGSAEDPFLITDNFQLEVNYAYMDSGREQKSEYFLIDVIDYNKLDKYLEVINNDVKYVRAVIGD